MAEEELLDRYQSFVFELDDVLYPEKDYLLQVYYLFAQFMEYTLHIDAAEMLKFMQEEYLNHGDNDIFAKTQAHFALEDQYQLNFDLLNRNAKLPLKLLMFPRVLTTLKMIVHSGKNVFLLTAGNPEKQLNKLRQLEWEGLAQHIKVYFADEIALKPDPGALKFLVQAYDLQPNKLLFVGKDIADENIARATGVNFLKAEEL